MCIIWSSVSAESQPTKIQLGKAEGTLEVDGATVALHNPYATCWLATVVETAHLQE